LTTNNISLSESKLFDKIIIDYINNDEKIRPFYAYEQHIDSFKEAIKNKRFDANQRKLLVDVLHHQYKNQGVELTPKHLTYKQINALSDSNTYTVTTGHQLCIYTGPLYFIYKIITTIKLAQNLKDKYPENHFVPVFWMASEDHDFEEINHIYVKGEKRIWNYSNNNQPVGRLGTDGIAELIEPIKPFCTHPSMVKQLDELANIYAQSKTLAEATRKIVHHLFQGYGLIVIDGDDKTLKEQTISLIKQDVFNQINHQIISQTNSKLKSNNYKIQVNGRTINYFYLSDAGRNLIKQNQQEFIVENTNLRFNETTLLKEIETHPERFSPNVILRPIYQEQILPNLAYIGGPGEIAYWLQLKDVFEANTTAFPVLWLRDFRLMIHESSINKFKKLQLKISDLYEDELAINRKLVALNDDGGQEEVIEQIDYLLQKLIDISQKTDNKLSSELITAKIELKDKLKKINQKLDQQQRLKVEIAFNKFKEIKGEYFKGKTMQERFDNLISFAVHYEIKPLIELLMQEPFMNRPDIRTTIIQ